MADSRLQDDDDDADLPELDGRNPGDIARVAPRPKWECPKCAATSTSFLGTTV